MRVLYPGRIGIWSVGIGFCGGEKKRRNGEKPSEYGENQQQTKPMYVTGPESNRGQIGGRWALTTALKYNIAIMVERVRKLLREPKANWEWNAILLGNMNRTPSFYGDFVTLSRSNQSPLSLCYSWMKKAKIILLNGIAGGNSRFLGNRFG